MVEHVVFIKTLSAPLQWTDDLRRIVGEPAPVLKQPDMFYVGVPAFLPFTRTLLSMSELPIEIIDISGHEALQVKVSCPQSTGKVFENDLSAHCIPGSRILFRFQYPQGAVDDRWHYAVALPLHQPSSLHCAMNFWRAAPRDIRTLYILLHSTCACRFLSKFRIFSVFLDSRTFSAPPVGQTSKFLRCLHLVGRQPQVHCVFSCCRFLTHGTT